MPELLATGTQCTNCKRTNLIIGMDETTMPMLEARVIASVASVCPKCGESATVTALKPDAITALLPKK